MDGRVPGVVLLALLLQLSAAPAGTATPDRTGQSDRSGRSPDAAPRAAQVDVRLTMDEKGSRIRDPVRRLKSTGGASVAAVVVAEDGGVARRMKGARSGWSVQLPSFVQGPRPPLAVVRVTSKKRNPLSPRSRDFAIGADFRLSKESAGTRMDDGDNLVQRSSYHSPNQYKLQADEGVPSCRIKGTLGDILVVADPVPRNRWHRALCERAGDTVTLRVWRLTSDGPVLRSTVTETAALGSVHHPRGVPLAVGGRLRDSGTLPLRDVDQFNGRIDRVIYDRR